MPESGSIKSHGKAGIEMFHVPHTILIFTLKHVLITVALLLCFSLSLCVKLGIEINSWFINCSSVVPEWPSYLSGGRLSLKLTWSNILNTLHFIWPPSSSVKAGSTHDINSHSEGSQGPQTGGMGKTPDQQGGL